MGTQNDVPPHLTVFRDLAGGHVIRPAAERSAVDTPAADTSALDRHRARSRVPADTYRTAVRP